MALKSKLIRRIRVMPKSKLRLIAVATDATIAKIKAATSSPWLPALLDLLDNTALRISEITGSSERYALKDGTIRETDLVGLAIDDVAEKIDGAWFAKDICSVVGKGSKERQIPLNAISKAAVLTLIAAQDKPRLRSRLLPLTRQSVSRAIRKAKKSAGIPDTERVTAHTCRHRVLTKLVRSGKVKEAQMLAGHSDSRITLNTYTHVSIRDLTRSMDELDTLQIVA